MQFGTFPGYFQSPVVGGLKFRVIVGVLDEGLRDNAIEVASRKLVTANLIGV